MKHKGHPTSELVRDNLGVPVLKLYNLGASQLMAIHETMVVNADTPIHDARSRSLAHLGTFDSFTGMVTISLHDETSGFYDLFLAMLAAKLDMTLPSIPTEDYLKTA